MKNKILIAVCLLCAGVIVSCSKDPKKPGYEFMPDMYRSPSYETYSANPNFTDKMTARKPPEGSIPRNHALYSYPNTNEGYDAAAALENPVPASEAVIAEGKRLYLDFCSHCHGNGGAGDGKMVQNEKFPPPPSFATQLKDLPNGKMFHSITYGKNMMGAHASQLTVEERWKIVHYLKVLQGK